MISAGASPLTTILLFLSLIGVLGGGDHDTRSVTTVTAKTLDDYLTNQRVKQRPALIMFHVGWCKACQRTFPLFIAASDRVQREKVPMDFAHADCTDDKSLCQRFEVTGYPTIKLFAPEEGKAPQNFRGTRTEVGFLNYAKRMTMPPIRNFESWSAYEKALSDEAYSGIIVEDRHAKDLQQVALRWMDRHIVASAPKLSDLLPEELRSQVPDDAYIAVLSLSRLQWKDSDEQAPPAVAFYKDVFDTTAIDNWIVNSRFPGIWSLSDANFFEYSHADKSAVVVALPQEVSSDVAQQTRGAQQALQSDYFFGVVNGEDWSKELTNLGIFPEELPRAFVIEKNFESWVEDINELRVSHLQQDLQKLSDGAPLLRQGRTIMHKVFLYKRKAWRFVLQTWAYGQQGNLQMATVVFAGLLWLALVIGFLWGLWSCCNYVMLEDEPEFSHVQRAASRPKESASKKAD